MTEARKNLAPMDFREAVARNDLQAVEKLFRHGEDINAVDEVGRTMFCLAITHGAMDVVRFFIDNGADVNRPGDSKIYPLMYAVCHERMEIARLLLEQGADINAKTEHNWTAAIYAAMGDRREEYMRLLIENGADVTVRDNRDGQSALDIAVRWGRAGTVELLKNAPEIYRKAEEARYQMKHVKIAARQEQLKAQAGKFKLKSGPQP